MDLVERIQAVVRLEPDAPAVEFEDRWHTWGDLARAMAELQAAVAFDTGRAASPLVHARYG